MHDPQTVLDFWFGDRPDDNDAMKDRGSFWFRSNPETDDEISDRFAACYKAAMNGELDDWAETADGRLALILVLDQFSRNLYRGQVEAFAGDEKARALCIDGVEKNMHATLYPCQQAFFFMPLEHSECADHQEMSVRLYERLNNRCGPEWRHLTDAYVDYAKSHRDVVLKFGRFPHRNPVIGRDSTAEELDFLDDGSATWGQ